MKTASSGRRLRALRRAPRRGATLVEMAIVLPVVLLVIAGTIDLGLSLHRRNATAWIAREAARQASVHGSMARPAMTTWGPEPVTWSNVMRAETEASKDIVAALEPFRASLSDPEAIVEFEWPSDSNHWGDPVRVTVRVPHRSLLPSLFGPAREHRASCTMQIAH